MLQLACVLTTGGIILFSSALCPDSEILTIVINKILESKLIECQIVHSIYKFQYHYEAAVGLIYVAIWRKQIILEYVDKFLHYFKNQIRQNYEKIIWKGDVIIDCPQFSQQFKLAFQKWNLYTQDKYQKDKVMTKFQQTEKGKKIKKKQKQQAQKPSNTQTANNNNSNILKSEQIPSLQNLNQKDEGSQLSLSPRSSVTDQELSPRQRFLRNQQQRNKQTKKKNKNEKIQLKQEKRIWQTTDRPLKKNQIENLDRSKYKKQQQTSKSDIYLDQQQKQVEGFVESDDEKIQQSTFFKKIVGSVQGVIGNKNITNQDLKPILASFKQKLMEKNVAQQVSQKIAQSVGKTLLQTKTKTFTSVQATVKSALRQALTKILTPKRHIDLIAEVAKSKLEHKPYVVVFIGVNGVGKSTNLAKVAYMLKNSKFSVMLAACDNFRAGAVEQIKVHGRNLDIPVFDRGYKEQPPEIAYQAIKQAIAKRIDVVLIDTAGRMQDNTPLMKALARLVSVNKPNLVVFIGEALVGNDAIDQITKFNQAISQYSSDDSRRQIDAILLSKFDTVDDKVGTAVTMCYATSKPILYVGVGQKYQNLRKLNISTMVQALMS